jgi:GNAT superfamily N-acetyltransferase
VIAYRESPWDAAGLGGPVATVDLVALAPRERESRKVYAALADALDAFATERKTLLDWLRVDAANVPWQDVLLRRGFRAVDFIFSLASPVDRLSPCESPRAGVATRAAREDDLPWLRRLASVAFTESRFLDERGPPGWNAKVYARWVEARLSQVGEGLRFLVAELRGEPAGFLVWKIHQTPGTSGLTGQVDLVAVSPGARGHGMGRTLFDEARRTSPPLSWMAADVYARNPLGLGLHMGYGLEIGATSAYLHRWHTR